MKNFIKNYPQKICNALEYVVALIVGLAIVAAILSLIPELAGFIAKPDVEGGLMEFLGSVFNVVIGIEFLKVLCKPNSDNIMETLIFLVARHMILGDTSPFEDFVSVISVAILCVLRRYLHVTRNKEDELLPKKELDKNLKDK